MLWRCKVSLGCTDVAAGEGGEAVGVVELVGIGIGVVEAVAEEVEEVSVVALADGAVA